VTKKWDVAINLFYSSGCYQTVAHKASNSYN